MRADTICKLILYSTSACHLCALAAELVEPWLSQGWTLEEVDIAEDDQLFDRYGLVIPVLHRPDIQSELSWPFDALTLKEFLESEQ